MKTKKKRSGWTWKKKRQQEPPQKVYYVTSEVLQILCISEQALRNLLKTENHPPYIQTLKSGKTTRGRVRRGSKLLFPINEFHNWLNFQTVDAADWLESHIRDVEKFKPEIDSQMCEYYKI